MAVSLWSSIVGKLLGTVSEKVADYYIQRQELKNKLEQTKLEGKIELTRAKFQAKARQQEMVHTWEMAQLNNSGVKDEVVLGVLLAPYVGAFIPVVQDYVLVGFGYLAQMPYWAVGLTVTIMLAVYGIRHRNASNINAPGLRAEDVIKASTPDNSGGKNK